MDCQIILDTTVTPNEIIQVTERTGVISVVAKPSNCVMIVSHNYGEPDVIDLVELPQTNQSINTSDLEKWYFHYDVYVLKTIWENEEGVDITLINDYIENNDLSGYEDPRRGYLIGDSEVLKPFLEAAGVGVSKIIEFEDELQ